MPSWTATLPTAPTLHAPVPATPTQHAALPGTPTVSIPVPHIQPAAAAAFTGIGTFTGPYISSQSFAVAVGSTGFLALLNTGWTQRQSPGVGAAGQLTARVAVGSGAVVAAAGFGGLGMLLRPNAPWASTGALAVAVAWMMPTAAPWSGLGVLTGTQTLGAAWSGAGALTVIESSVSVTEPAALTATGTLTAQVAAIGAVVVPGTFTGAGTGSDPATSTVKLPAAAGGIGTLSVASGQLGGFTGIGTLSGQVGVISGFGSVGTVAGVVAFPAAFAGVSAALFLVGPQAQFFATGLLSAAAHAAVPEPATLSGTGALSAAVNVGLPAALSGVGTLFPTEYIRWTAVGTGTGNASVAVSWSEAEAGAFTGTGTLSALVIAPGLGTAFALVFERPDQYRASAANLAAGQQFTRRATTTE